MYFSFKSYAIQIAKMNQILSSLILSTELIVTTPCKTNQNILRCTVKKFLDTSAVFLLIFECLRLQTLLSKVSGFHKIFNAFSNDQ